MGNKPSSFGTTSVYKSENENEVKPKDLKIRDGYYRNKQNASFLTSKFLLHINAINA